MSVCVCVCNDMLVMDSCLYAPGLCGETVVCLLIVKTCLL